MAAEASFGHCSLCGPIGSVRTTPEVARLLRNDAARRSRRFRPQARSSIYRRRVGARPLRRAASAQDQQGQKNMMNQRWRNGRDSYRIPDEVIRTSDYEIVTMTTEREVRHLIGMHHYSEDPSSVEMALWPISP